MENEELNKYGCSFGQIEAQKMVETVRRVRELESNWKWLIGISFGTLVGVAFNIGLSFMKFSPTISHYPLP